MDNRMVAVAHLAMHSLRHMGNLQLMYAGDHPIWAALMKQDPLITEYHGHIDELLARRSELFIEAPQTKLIHARFCESKLFRAVQTVHAAEVGIDRHGSTKPHIVNHRHHWSSQMRMIRHQFNIVELNIVMV
jgi:hypothetical protein